MHDVSMCTMYFVRPYLYLQGHWRPIVHIAAVSGPCIGYGTRTREAWERIQKSNLSSVCDGQMVSLCRNERGMMIVSMYVSIRMYYTLNLYTTSI